MRKGLLIPLIFGLAGAGILVGLGIWQMQRLTWKEGVLAEIETRIAAEPGALPAQPAAQADQYLPVRVEGEFGEGALKVLVSRKRVGAGHLIISPFETATGRRILVDRGFLKLDTDLPAAPQTPVTITGNLHWPDDRNSSTPANDVADNTWFARDIPQMAEVLGTEPILLTSRRIAPPEAALTPLPVDTTHIPNDHLQYAVTWFSLAAVWLVMTGYYITRSRKPAKGPGT
ncbi:SURF1 family protein [Roseovarius aestuariivivens]|uniref:SURF1 family protein n=1 Tax=Roseovarius aestuariivivens TaxID=1888910 RepID=UPI0010811E0E|nr:SURF1 family protein [Roseovarius aestuariivivens]